MLLFPHINIGRMLFTVLNLSLQLYLPDIFHSPEPESRRLGITFTAVC
jgi:hypothetical protein